MLENKQEIKDKQFKKEFLGWLIFFVGMSFMMAITIFAFIGFLLVV